MTAGARKKARLQASPVAKERRKRARRRLAWVAFGCIVALAVLQLIDFGIGRYQAHLVDQRKKARQKLDQMVLHYLRADVLDVYHTADGKYRVRIYIENVYPEYDMYVLLPQVSTSAQVGPAWHEVPTRDPGDGRLRAGSVVKLVERIVFEREFELPADKEYFQLLAGFYHVKFDNMMLVSPVPEPKEDIAERADNYFIHLRPVGSNIDEIRKKNQFPGGNVPIYLPMPPH
jgi:hypothetical protein